MNRAFLMLVLVVLAYAYFGARALASPASTTSTQFIAKTKARFLGSTANNGAFSYRYQLSFPTNTVSNLTITVQINQRYVFTKSDKPGSQIYGLTYTDNAATRTSTVRYFIPYSSLPPSEVQQLRSLGSTADNPLDLQHPSLLQVTYSRNIVADAGGEGANGEPGQNGLGAWITIIASWANKGLEDFETFLQVNGDEAPALLETTSLMLQGGLAAQEAYSITTTDAALLQQIAGYRECAHQLAAQDSNYQEAANLADYAYSKAYDLETTQFLFLLGNFFAKPVETVENVFSINPVKGGEASIEQLLQQLQQALPQCRGRWYGTYRIRATMTGVGFSYEDVGHVLFSVNGGVITGTVDGVQGEKLKTPFETASGTTSYHDTLGGSVNYSDPKIAIANLDWGDKSTPKSFSVHGEESLGPDLPPEPLEEQATVQNWGGLAVGLSETVPNDTNFKPPGNGHYTFILRKLR
jgi:hypothetical protein